LFGVLIVVWEAFSFSNLGFMVFQVINNPAKVKIVEFVLRHIQTDDKAIFGSLNHKRLRYIVSKSFKSGAFLLFREFSCFGLWRALLRH